MENYKEAAISQILFPNVNAYRKYMKQRYIKKGTDFYFFGICPQCSLDSSLRIMICLLKIPSTNATRVCMFQTNKTSWYLVMFSPAKKARAVLKKQSLRAECFAFSLLQSVECEELNYITVSFLIIGPLSLGPCPSVCPPYDEQGDPSKHRSHHINSSL